MQHTSFTGSKVEQEISSLTSPTDPCRHNCQTHRTIKAMQLQSCFICCEQWLHIEWKVLLSRCLQKPVNSTVSFISGWKRPCIKFCENISLLGSWVLRWASCFDFRAQQPDSQDIWHTLSSSGGIPGQLPWKRQQRGSMSMIKSSTTSRATSIKQAK